MMTETQSLQEQVQRLVKAKEDLELEKCKLQRHVKELMENPPVAPLPEILGGNVGEDARTVQAAFRRFLKVYYLFKKEYGLPHTYDDGRDMGLALVDKVGRIIRHVKHHERNDPIPEWYADMERGMFGAVAYLVMIGYKYGIGWEKGMIAELQCAVIQHGGKTESSGGVK